METNKTILSVTDYGADPAGKRDSTEALQAALEAARNTPGPVTLLFPKGEYHFIRTMRSGAFITPPTRIAAPIRRRRSRS